MAETQAADNQAKKFLDDVFKNKNLQDKLPDIHKLLQGIGKVHGYDFSKEEIKAELRRRWGKEDEVDPDTCLMCVCV